MNKYREIIFCSIVVKFALEYIYPIVCKLDGLYGFSYEVDGIRYLISWLLWLLIPYSIIKFSNKETFSKQVIACFLFCSYLPGIVMYVYNPTVFICVYLLFYVLLVTFTLYLPSIRISYTFSNKFQNYCYTFLVILFCLTIYFVWASYADFRLQFDITDVYNVRMEARKYIMPFPFNYIFAMSKTTIPLIMIYSLHRRKYILTLFFAVTQFILFSIDATKSTFFTVIVGLSMFFVVSKYNRWIAVLPRLALLGVSASLLEYIVFDTANFIMVIIRRVMFIPALLNYKWYEYFENNGYDFYLQSIGKICGITSNYELPLPRLIGLEYFGRVSMNANNGMFSDAWANLGIVGVCLMPLLVVVMLKCIEGAIIHIPNRVGVVFVINIFFALNGSSFFTAMLTHGIVFNCLIMLLLDANNLRKDKCKTNEVV